MRIKLVVESQEEYDKWMRSQKATFAEVEEAGESEEEPTKDMEESNQEEDNESLALNN